MTAPKITSITAVGPRAIQITFDQSMSVNEYLTSPSSYSITPSLIAYSEAVVVVVSSNVIQLRLAVNMKNSQLYTLVASNLITNINDEALDSLFDTDTFFGLGDPPKLELAEATSKDKIRLTFSEPINLGTLTDVSNYNIRSESTGKSLVIGAIEPVELGTQLYGMVDLIVTSKMTKDGQHKVTVSNMLDVAGNPQLAPISKTFIGIAELPRLVSAKLSPTGKLVVQFDTPLQPIIATSLTSYILYSQKGVPKLYYSKAVLSSDGKQVELDVSEPRNNAYYAVSASPAIIDEYGNEIDKEYSSTIFIGVGLAPTISKCISIGKNRLDLTFSEKIKDCAAVRDPSRYSVDNGLTVVAVLQVDGDTVKLATTNQLPGVLYTLTITS